jgi:tRNA(fMet)-specific endonuclease VapC
MTYLLDTDTIVYWMKNHPVVTPKARSIDSSLLSASDISRAELYYGAYYSDRIEHNVRAVKNLSNTLAFLPFNEDCQIQFGKIKADLRKRKALIADPDIMIAATALAFSRILVTNNTKHFQRIEGLTIENWA